MTIAEIGTIAGCILLGVAFLFLIVSRNSSKIYDLEQKVETLEKNLLDLINEENNNENI